MVAGGRVYVATAEGDVYVLDAKTGCVHWTLEVEAGIRSAITLDQRGNGQLVAYFGDQAANVYAVDAKAGKVLWKVEVDEHPHAAITAAPQLYNGRLYVPVSSREESQVGDARYPCCSFRGSVVALDATTGKRLWKTYSVAETPGPTAKNSIGTQLYGPAGGAIWNTPTIDTQTERSLRRDRKQLCAAGHRIVGFAGGARPERRSGPLGPPGDRERHLEWQLPAAQS